MSTTMKSLQDEWVHRVLGNAPRRATGRMKGPRADALDALYAELLRVEQLVISTSKPSKPATLAGKFGYATSVIASTGTHLAGMKDEEVRGATRTRAATAIKAKEVKSLLESARTTQIDRSLKALQQTVQDHEQVTAALEQRPRTAAEDKSAVYEEASAHLTEAMRVREDWQGQVDEARVWMAGKAGSFITELEKLDAQGRRLESVIAACLPSLTSRVAKPGETPARGGGTSVEEITDPLAALKACGMSWVTAKQTYGADKTQMQKLADFRQKIVDDWLKENLGPWGMKVGPDLGWVSVGSQDPTSDYDISINKHGAKGEERRLDFELVKDFNAWFRGKFGAEAGTVFDTNLYAAAPSMVTEKDPDAADTNDVAALMKLRRYMSSGEFEAFRVETMKACGKNDKQRAAVERQFAEADTNFRIVMSELLLAGKNRLEQRISSREGQGLQPEETRKLDGEERKLLGEVVDYLGRSRQASGIALYDLQDEAEALAHELDHALKDATLLATNELYADKKGDVRGNEMVMLVLQDLNKALAGSKPDKEALVKALKSAAGMLTKIKIGGSPVESGAIDTALKALEGDDESGFNDALSTLKSSLESELGMRRIQLGSATAIGMFFANEAYQSDGPFAHVVTATQAAESEATAGVVAHRASALTDEDRKGQDAKHQVAFGLAGGKAQFGQLPEEEQGRLLKQAGTEIDTAVKKLKEERQGAMSPEQCLQSFNEQLGDFLKDLEHYGEEAPGKAIIQSSKYLDRLLDAVRLLADKKMFDADSSLLEALRTEIALQGRIKGELIAARKGNLMLMPQEENGPPVDQEEQRRAYACDFMKQLGVTSLAGLARKYVGLGVKINAAARRALAG